MLRRTLWLPFLVLACLIGTAGAQSITFGVAFRDLSPAAHVELRDFSTGSGTAALRVSVGSQVELDLRYRQAASLAGIGNLVTSLVYQGNLLHWNSVAASARGVVGPVAARARASVGNREGFARPIAEGALPEPPRLRPGPPLWALEVGGSYRQSRELVIDLGPGIYLSDGRWGARLSGELRWLRAIDDDDLSLLLHTFVSPVDASGSAALGIGYTLNRSRAPSWSASGWIGMGGGRFSPGLRISGGERIGTGTFSLTMRAEPYRLDDWPYQADITASFPTGRGRVEVDMSAGIDGKDETRFRAEVGYRIDLD